VYLGAEAASTDGSLFRIRRVRVDTAPDKWVDSRCTPGAVVLGTGGRLPAERRGNVPFVVLRSGVTCGDSRTAATALPGRFLATMLCSVVAGIFVTGCPSAGTAGSVATCLACHNGRIAEDMRIFLLSAHRSVDCATCHVGAEAHVESGGTLGTLINPAVWPFEQSYGICKSCHKQEVKTFEASAHAQSRRVACYDCHNVHSPLETMAPVSNNLACLNCHAPFGFRTNDEISAHTNHPVDPSGTGASRCTTCHMPPLVRENQTDGPHSHSFDPIPPIVSANQALEGEPVLPNSCAGTTGCHDGTVPTAPVFDVDNPGQMTGLQGVFEIWYGTDKSDLDAEWGGQP
jgi:hypothetical protein